MKLLRFTAEASLYKSNKRYMMGGVPSNTTRLVACAEENSLEQEESGEQTIKQTGDEKNPPAKKLSSESHEETPLSPQSENATSGRGTPGGEFSYEDITRSITNSVRTTVKSYVYALGRVEAHFPTIAIEKEFAQATGRAETVGLTDRQALHSVLSENRYLIRQLCWVLTIEGLATYILRPCCPRYFDLLVDALRPAPRPTDVDVVIGVRGPIAPPEVCNGLMVPIVMFDQMYSFDVDSLIKSIPRPEKKPEKQFASAAEELFWKIVQMADNAGATDEHRAMNYLAVRYPAIYAKAAECYGRDSSLTAVEVRPSRLSGVRKIVDVIFSYTNRKTDVTEKYFVRVDVTEAFPFLVTKMSAYYDR